MKLRGSPRVLAFPIIRYELLFETPSRISYLFSTTIPSFKNHPPYLQNTDSIQISKRMGRSIPHLTFFDQSSYNVKVRDPTSIHPYIGRFDNTDLRWPMFGDKSEIAFLKGCADTSGMSSKHIDTAYKYFAYFPSVFPARCRCHCQLPRTRYETE